MTDTVDIQRELAILRQTGMASGAVELQKQLDAMQTAERGPGGQTE